jgi:hypothetical protein
MLTLAMSLSRMQQIIAHERSIYRSLIPFGLTLALVTAALIVFAVRG